MSELKGDFAAFTDAELVAEGRKGNKRAIELLISRHYLTCVRLATLILHDRGDAQDEVQQACCKAFQHLDQFHGAAEFLAWLLRIVSNECLMLIRSRSRARFVYLDSDTGREGSHQIELQSTAADPEREAIEHQMKHVLETEIRHIPPLFRNVILLRVLAELPISSVAERLRITVPAAKSRLKRARIELREPILKHSIAGPLAHAGSRP